MTTMVVLLENIAKIYRNEIWKIYKVLQKVLSSRGPQFTLWFMKNLSKALKIRKTLSIAYYSQIDSQMERINQEVKVFLQNYVNYQQNNWTE